MAKPRPPETLNSNASCLFCQIVAGEVAAKVVFEDAISLAFLDIRPLFAGHCLLISKEHFQTLGDLPGPLVGPLFTNAQLLARTVQEVMKAEGTFVAINNTISQSVPHFHIHIVPRRKGDGLRGFFWPRQKYQDVELDAVQQALLSRSKT
jgi:histidine triad (HIT) family protein